MADDSESAGKSIADAYRTSSGNGGASSDSGKSTSAGASIADAYRTQDRGGKASAAIPDWHGLATSSGETALDRVIKAARDAWMGTGAVLTPAQQQAMDQTIVGKYLTHPLAEVSGIAINRGPLAAGMAALYGGATTAVGETINALTGTGERGIGSEIVHMPDALAGSPHELAPPNAYPPGPRVPSAPPTPRFVQEYYGEGTPANPLAAGAPPPADAFVPPGTAPPTTPATPAFVPPGSSAYPPGTPRAADAPPVPNALAYGTPTPEGVGGVGGLTPPPPRPPGGASGPSGATPEAAPVVEQPAPGQQTQAPPASITPILTRAQAEAEADRILQHFASGKPVTIDSAPTASGAQPTLSQSIPGGHAGIAGLERGIRDAPEHTVHFVNRETENTTKRNEAVSNVIGDSRATDVIEAELNKRTGPGEAAIFDPTKTSPVDPSPAIDAIDDVLKGKHGQRDVIKSTLEHLRGKLVDKEGNLQTDPALLRGVDLAIGDMISPKAAGTAHDGRAAAHELMAARDVLRTEIEKGAPGYKAWLAEQAQERSAIDGQRFLQARNITDRAGNVNLGTLDSTIKMAERQQRMPGARLADGVTDEQLAQLRALRDDFRNDARQRAGASIGSPTVQKLGVSALLDSMGHPLIAGGGGVGAAWLAGINPVLGMGVGALSYGLKQQSARGQRMVLEALREKLLNPEKARSAFPSKP